MLGSVGFGFYSAVLVRLKYESEACIYGDLATRMYSKFPVREFATRTLASVWGNVHPQTHPLRTCLMHLEVADQTGFETGDYQVLPNEKT
jgi:hypothetical protein